MSDGVKRRRPLPFMEWGNRADPNIRKTRSRTGREIILCPVLNPESKFACDLIYEDTFNFYVRYPGSSSNIFIFTKFAWAESEEMSDEVKRSLD